MSWGTAGSPLRLNQNHPETVFRVRMGWSEAGDDLLLQGNLDGV
jgi:hypothetical protein